MTYLMAEMLLYLLVTAVIGFFLGWLVFAAGRWRQVEKVRSELMLLIDHERKDHQGTRELLHMANANVEKAALKSTAEAEQKIQDMQVKIDSDRKALHEAHAAVEQMREKLNETVRAGEATNKSATLRANKDVETEKARAAQAVANEATALAQLEELRLLIGTERLAADNARNELEKTRREAGDVLQSEREEHQKAKTALEEIQTALARAVGPAAALLASEPTDKPDNQDRSHGDDQTDPQFPTLVSSDLLASSDMALADDALNNPDPDEADSEDREDVNVDLPETIDVDEPAATEQGDALDPAFSPTANPPEPPHSTQPHSTDEEASEDRPEFLYAGQPGRVDDLQAIDDIGAAIEARLHNIGCYHFSQLARMTSADIDWLAEAIDIPSERIMTERWIEKARELEARVDGANDGEAAATKVAG